MFTSTLFVLLIGVCMMRSRFTIVKIGGFVMFWSFIALGCMY